jgi:predicted phosphodiesterase
MAKIVLFSDLHYGHQVAGLKGRTGVNIHGEVVRRELGRLRRAIDGERPDIVINLGDLVGSGSAEEARQFYGEVLKEFSSWRLYHLLGNHEFDHLSAAEIERILGQPPRQSFLAGGFKHILLDAYRDHQGPGTTKVIITAESLAFLEKELSTGEPAIIYCHFPVSEAAGNLGYWFNDCPRHAFIDRSGEVKVLIKKHGVRAFISGHTHFPFEMEIDGCRHVTIPALGEDSGGQPSRIYATLELPSLRLDFKNY